MTRSGPGAQAPRLPTDAPASGRHPEAAGARDAGIGRNVELKARDPAPEATLETCQRLGAVDCGVLWQQDTYFNATHGRLKLREQRPGRTQLIHYDRPDEPQQRESRYRILEIADVEALRTLLTESLGVWATVTKRRRLFLWRSVRIHLDDVEGLGAFIELEAVARPESDLEAEHQLIDELRAELTISDQHLLPQSYAEQTISSGRS
jgi:adenylate cyclase class 2